MTVYTPLLRKRLLAALGAGCPWRVACQAAGLTWSTWTRWLRAARQGTEQDPLVARLVADAEQAHGAATAGLVAEVYRAGSTDWRAAMGLLDYREGSERRRHEATRAHWEAKLAKAKVQAVAKGGDPLTPDERAALTSYLRIRSMPDAELEAELAAHEARPPVSAPP